MSDAAARLEALSAANAETPFDLTRAPLLRATLVKLGGDVITKVNGRRVTRENDFSEQITRYAPGETISLELYRGNERRTARVTLDERPDQVPNR